MKTKSAIDHNSYYFIELLVLLFGFFLIVFFSYSIILQFMILTILLMSYISLGFVHHFVNHTFSSKIVIEYTLVSALILAGFLFLNINRL